MGPFPHSAPRSVVSDANPMGTDGFEFVEYASTEPEKLKALFEKMGFDAVARHRSRNVTLFRQGDVNFVVNAEPESFARRFAEAHGPCACAMAFRVADAKHAFDRAVQLGATPVINPVGPMELNIPAIEGIGGSLLYLPLRRLGHDLRRRFPLDRGARAEARRRRAILCGPPHP
jgi:4-hydroxyphenylpyruvate dioxygenase